MTAITNCPSCQTQFIVTDVQLNQHNGKVRCGNCLHVFDATKEIIEENVSTEIGLSDQIDSDVENQDSIIEINVETGSTPLENDTNDIVDKTQFKDHQNIFFDNTGRSTITRNALYNWLIGFSILLLVLSAIAQSIYFLRTQISVNYPNLKPYLVQACEKIACIIDLPKKIEFIIIDDSDMQEDADYVGLIHLSSTLINQASFIQAYPNIELTLTDVEDRPKLRRIFKPEEYLPEHTDIANGLAGGAEIKVKLAITAQGDPVAGYRLAVNY
jgi:predicted Zn finger-like uncharacterized protein